MIRLEFELQWSFHLLNPEYIYCLAYHDSQERIGAIEKVLIPRGGKRLFLTEFEA
jgi:hypothetical protein